mgnify:CR=1 FL=1
MVSSILQGDPIILHRLQGGVHPFGVFLVHALEQLQDLSSAQVPVRVMADWYRVQISTSARIRLSYWMAVPIMRTFRAVRVIF